MTESACFLCAPSGIANTCTTVTRWVVAMRYGLVLSLEILAILALFGSGAHAQTDDQSLAGLRPPVVNVNNELGIAAQGFIQSYTETMGGHVPDSEHGTLPGIQLKVSGMFDTLGVDNLYVGLTYQREWGDAAYNGFLLNGTPHTGTTNYGINDVRLEVGKGFLLSENAMLTPFFQAGWRSWKRTLSPFQDEDYADYYAGGGVRGDLSITDRLVLDGRLGIAATIDPAMTSAQSVVLGLPRMNFKLGIEPLLQAGIGADYLVYKYVHLYGGAEYSRFAYGASAVNQFGFLEPASVTDEIVFRLGVAVGL
jgi:hypothetical protein